MKEQLDQQTPIKGSSQKQRQGKPSGALGGLSRALSSLRLQMLPYMLIFSLAPIFPNMKNSLVTSADRILGMDGIYTMGIAYSLGIGLIHLLVKPAVLHRVAKSLSMATAALFLGWILAPLSPFTPWLGLFFSLGLGGCAGIALFGFTYALNDMERLFGAAITVLFCMISQIIFSLPPLWSLSGPLYLAAQVLVTLLCFVRYKPQDYLKEPASPPAKGPQALTVALFFFFAHRAVVFFFSYLPHALSTPLVGLAGIAVFLVSLYVFFAFRFNTWYLCVFFFIGMLVSYFLRLALPEDSGMLASDIIHGFGYMGYIASYYLLGFALSRYVDYRRFRLIILVIFNSSLLLHVIPGALNRFVPEGFLIIGTAMTAGLFVVFVLLSPVFSKEMFQPEEKDSRASLLALMQERGLTAREQEIALMLLEGHLLKECAITLDISYGTVKFHATNIYRKLDIGGRSELLSAFKDW
jgi:DNA-binding CsgD family transcriptional regulator